MQMDWVEQVVGEDVPGNDGNEEESLDLPTICLACGLEKEKFPSTRTI